MSQGRAILKLITKKKFNKLKFNSPIFENLDNRKNTVNLDFLLLVPDKANFSFLISQRLEEVISVISYIYKHILIKNVIRGSGAGHSLQD